MLIVTLNKGARAAAMYCNLSLSISRFYTLHMLKPLLVGPGVKLLPTIVRLLVDDV